MENYAQIANQYAKKVVSGKIKACIHVKNACKRHLDDLAASKSKKFPYKWDETAANRICAFASMMVHVKGREWAGKKNRLTALAMLSSRCTIRVASQVGWPTSFS